MTDSELHHSVKRRLQLLRPYMIGLKTDQHWLRLHKMVRSVFAEAFAGGISDQTLAGFVHVPESVMAGWHKQHDQLIALKEKIAKPEVLMSDGGSAFYSWRGVSQLTLRDRPAHR